MCLTSSLLVISAILLLCSGQLIIRPDRSWFLRYENVSFSCLGPPDGSQMTRVFRNASSRYLDPCESGWGTIKGSICNIEALFTLDSGVYWCGLNQMSDSISITVTSDPVILSVPVHPVLQGALVTLACLSNDPKMTEFEASFFKNGSFIGKMSPAHLTLSSVTPKHHGLYRCEHPTRGSSREVLLRVSSDKVPATSRIPETTTPPPIQPIMIALPRLLCFSLLFLLYTSIFCISLCICYKLAKARAEEKRRSVYL